MKIRVITVGKIKEKYLTDGINEYKKRISAFAELELIELKEINTDDTEKNLRDEAVSILNTITTNDYVITLEIKGKELDSVELANMIKEHYTYSSKVITFVIGSSCGLDSEVIKRSDYHLSFGKMTFPHQVMRLVLMEQIYRCMMINNNHKYHK